MLYIFDIGGVVTTSAAIQKDISNMLGITELDFLNYCGATAETLKQHNTTDLITLLSNGSITTTEFWKIFSERSEKNIKTDYWRLLFHPHKNLEVYKIIDSLKKQNNRVVCGTNTIQSHYETHVARGDYSIFEQVYASNYLGVSKPNPEFWKLILAAENTNPQDAFFIDDREDNCKAASDLGLQVHHFVTAENLHEALQTVI